ncbi:unnamed protein product, partial [Iphiclides podalirius]
MEPRQNSDMVQAVIEEKKEDTGRDEEEQDQTPEKLRIDNSDDDLDSSVALNAFIKTAHDDEVWETCPAQTYYYLDEVVVASRKELRSRCKRCTACKLVKTILNIACLLQMRVVRSILEPESNLIGKFEPLHDESDELTNFADTYQRSPQEVVPSPPALYLDIAKETQYVVEVRWTWVAKAMKYALTAAIKMKKQHIKVTRLSLKHHVNILNQLANYMGHIFKYPYVEPIYEIPTGFFFFNHSLEMSIEDVVTETIATHHRYKINKNPSEIAQFIKASRVLGAYLESRARGRKATHYAIRVGYTKIIWQMFNSAASSGVRGDSGKRAHCAYLESKQRFSSRAGVCPTSHFG